MAASTTAAKALLLSRFSDLSLKPSLHSNSTATSLLFSRHLLRPLLHTIKKQKPSSSSVILNYLFSGIDGGGVADEFISTRKFDFDHGFSVISTMLKRIELLDNSTICKGVSPEARESMKRTISTMLGLLPSDQFSVTIRVLRGPLDRLLVSSITTGTLVIISMGKLPHILVVPFPAQGHVMPLIIFSHQLVDHGFKVTFVNIESIHKKLVSTFLNDEEKEEDSRINLVSIPDGLVSGDLEKFTGYLFETMPFLVGELIKKINESDDENIDCVVADATIGPIVEIAEKFGIKRAAIWPASLGVLAFMLHFPKLVEAGDIDDNGDLIKEEVIRLPLSMPAMFTIDTMWGYSKGPTTRQLMPAIILSINTGARAANWVLCNSFYELEPASHDFIPNILSIGPLLASERLGHPNGQLLPEDSTCLTWLDQQPVQSVTYVAFGSTTIFEQRQFSEVAHGLELMDRPFLWVVRPGLSAEISTTVLDSFKDRTAHQGKVVDWAPQPKVLAHPSIACFITHCGWNSTMEGVSNGVPLLCWPYLADQFHNQNYICDIWKVGFKFNKNENGIITRSEIKKKVDELLGDEGIRSRANKLKGMAKRSVSEGGLSSKNFKDFINWIQC